MAEFYYTKEEPFIGILGGIVTVPDDFDKEKESLPVILFLHGAGERGKGTPETVDKVKVHGVPKYFSKDPCFMGVRAVTVSPQCPEGFIWDQLTFQLKDYLDAVIEEYHGDVNNVSVTGLSMGGYGTWNLITTYPGFFSCAAPVCGGGVSWRARDTLHGKKIWAFHSTDDGAVPFTCSVDMVQRAEQSGADVKFTAFTGLGHGCWEAAYETTKVIEWLASGGNIT